MSETLFYYSTTAEKEFILVILEFEVPSSLDYKSDFPKFKDSIRNSLKENSLQLKYFITNHDTTKKSETVPNSHLQYAHKKEEREQQTIRVR
jgi:hypothetical protein